MNAHAGSNAVVDRTLSRADIESVVSAGAPGSLADCDLNDADLSGLNLIGWQFKRCNLRKTKFHGAKLAETIWTGCRGAFADFSSSELIGARFQASDFNNAVFRRSGLATAQFIGCKLSGVDLAGVKALGTTFEDVLLIDAILPALSFRKTNLVRVDFSQADLSRCDFRDCVFEQCSLRGATLKGARFEGADLRGADLGGMRVEDAGLYRGATISRVQASQLLAELGLKIG